MRRETKTITGAAILIAGVLAPVVALAQDEGPREVEVPNPMGPHTWFIIVAIGAFLAWCISYVLQLQRERMTGQAKPQRDSLLRRKEELLDRLAKLESEKESGTIAAARYEKEFRKLRGQLSEILGRLGSRQKSTES
jgi:hypothetical protein